MDNEGNRLMAKYYDKSMNNNELSSLKDQKQFEKGLFEKTRKGNGAVCI